jgi:hypothetical protein
MKKPMAGRPQAAFLEMFREFSALDKRRCNSGVTPLEFLRWRDLKERLAKRFEQHGVAKGAKPRSTRLRLEFATPSAFVETHLEGLTGGDGIFLNTPFAMPVGRSFVAVVHIESTGEEIHLPCAVVSANVGSDHSTINMGMGVRFGPLSDEQREQLRALRAAGGAAAGAD